MDTAQVARWTAGGATSPGSGADVPWTPRVRAASSPGAGSRGDTPGLRSARKGGRAWSTHQGSPAPTAAGAESGVVPLDPAVTTGADRDTLVGAPTAVPVPDAALEALLARQTKHCPLALEELRLHGRKRTH